ncbi:hypothetical protein M011DRAFT_225445 [Sporormia fimetaria CBS 119925]|uniref:F-box domain-containing protein n=1 Tax=Sporormia fimetaria CBS 119925 TaxID=1340428 RepID=A0A6A6V034_9PLEO|nr:hypothetical protein M011DRAFT_225445 [Sporormia fimetaria CBS 119925]
MEILKTKMTSPPPRPHPHVHNYHSGQSFLVAPADVEKLILKCTFTPGLETYTWDAHPAKLNAKVGRDSLDDSNPFRKIPPTIGTLESLPLDLILSILDYLTIDDVFNFRKACVGAWTLLNSLPVYRVILTHAYRAYCTLIRTRAAAYVTLADFYKLLCTEKCGLCKQHFGPYVYLHAWTRICTTCKNSHGRSWRPSQICNRRLAVKLLHLSKRSRRRLGYVYDTVPDHGAPREDYVYVLSAINQYRYDHAGHDRGSTVLDAYPPANVMDRLYQDALRYDQVCPLPSYDPETGDIRRSLRCAGCEFVIQGQSHGSWPGPFYPDQWVQNDMSMEWSEQGFLEHFAWCVRAQRLWTKSKGGKVNSWRIISKHAFESKWMQPPA